MLELEPDCKSSYTDCTMKDFSLPTLFIILGIFCSALFLSYIATVKKSFLSTQPVMNSQKSRTLKQKQKILVEDAEMKRKILMENYQQKIKENRRNY